MPRQPGADHRKVRFSMAARRLINYQGAYFGEAEQ